MAEVEEFIFKINRKFFAIFLSIATALFGIINLYFHWDNPKELFTSLSIHILATLLVALFITIIFLYKKTEESKEKIEILGPRNIVDHELELARQNTENWFFSGGTGTITRRVTLPILGSTAKNKNRVKQVKILIINPDDAPTCKNYSAYRLRNTSIEEWTERKVQLKVYSTILACLYWAKNSPLNIEIYLRNYFSSLRYDISDDRVIISKSDPKEPAFLVSKPNIFHDSLIQEFFISIESAKKVDMSKNSFLFKDFLNENNTLTKEILIQEFSKIGIDEQFTDKEFDYIVLNAKPDYGKCK
jgi:hypothetical protein